MIDGVGTQLAMALPRRLDALLFVLPTLPAPLLRRRPFMPVSTIQKSSRPMLFVAVVVVVGAAALALVANGNEERVGVPRLLFAALRGVDFGVAALLVLVALPLLVKNAENGPLPPLADCCCCCCCGCGDA